MEPTEEKNNPSQFLRDFVAYWRGPKDILIKFLVILGLLLHVSFFISLHSGLWDTYFHDSARLKSQQGTDFFAIYLAGHQLIHGETLYPLKKDPTTGATLYEPDTENPKYLEVVPYFDPFRYLPVAGYLGIPLNLVGPWTAYWLWIIFYEFLFFASILWLGHHFRTQRGLSIAAALYFFFTPWYPEIYMGQYSFLQGFFILGMILAADRGRFARDSWWWIVSVMWKLNTAICIPAIIKWRHSKQILWLLLAIVLTCAPYFAQYPIDAVKFIFFNFRAPGPAASGNFGFQGFLTKLTLAGNLDNAHPFTVGLHLVTIVGFIALSIFATIRANKSRLAECLCLWIVTYFLIYIDVWEHQYVMLLPVMAFLYLKRPNVLLWVVWFLLACPTTYKYFHEILISSGFMYNPLKDTSFLNDWHYTLIKPLGLLGLYYYSIKATLGK